MAQTMRPLTYFEQLKEKIDADLEECERLKDAYEVWLFAWLARHYGYPGYEEGDDGDQRRQGAR